VSVPLPVSVPVPEIVLDGTHTSGTETDAETGTETQRPARGSGPQTVSLMTC